jgi:hypothetical protein
LPFLSSTFLFPKLEVDWPLALDFKPEISSLFMSGMKAGMTEWLVQVSFIFVTMV